MSTFSELLNNLCGKMIVVLATLLVELIIFVRKQRSSPVTTRQYIKFIEEKNPTICYTKRLKEVVECRVCLSEFEEGEKVRKLNCEHTFHKDCLDKWLQLQECWATCPLCRKQVLPNDVVSKHRQHRNEVEGVSVNGNEEDYIPFFLSPFRGGHHASHRYL